MGWVRRFGAIFGTAAAAAAAIVASVAAAPSPSPAAAPATSASVNYCQAIPSVNVTPQMWGYHAGQPIAGATGSYSRGHGTFNPSTSKATGIICQVDRVRNQPDREIVLSIGSKAIYHSHTAYKFGVEGNIVKLSVKVKSTTDPKCAAKTKGRVTIFASYNGVHKDDVRFWFPVACRDHKHNYAGPRVVTNVPPN